LQTSWAYEWTVTIGRLLWTSQRILEFHKYGELLHQPSNYNTSFSKIFSFMESQFDICRTNLPFCTKILIQFLCQFEIIPVKSPQAQTTNIRGL